MTLPATSAPLLGIIIVCFDSADVVLDCLASLLGVRDVALRIVVVDNASTDGTTALLRRWMTGEVAHDPPAGLRLPPGPLRMPLPPEAPHRLEVIEAGRNGGFAAGVNLGLARLMADPAIDRAWILNPDSVVAPDAARALATAPGGFGLMGARVVYLETPDRIQIDGGLVRWWTGVTDNVNQYRDPATTPPPDPAAMDFVMGASLVVSRAFVERAGPMPEDYFLYYEEVDWALRRGDLPIAWCEGALVYHRAGTAIGSPTPGRPASPFSLWFKHRARLRFLRRHFPWAVPTALLYSAAKAGQLALRGHGLEAWTILAGSLGLPPPAVVRDRLSPEAQARAFGRIPR